ncbi:MAG: AEC family transporter [Neisseriaceae bacterium]|nr:AEC family transporter [Neisseriaceae bacterium]
MLHNFLTAFQFSIGVTLPTVFLLLFGLFLQRTGQIDGAFSQAASKLMFNWALPALLFFAIVESQVSFGGQIQLLAAGAIVALILFTAAEIVAYFLIEKRDRGVFVQGIYRGNTAIIGLAFCANAYGADGIAVGAVFTGTMTLLYNVLAVITLSRSLEKSNTSVFSVVKNIIKNPLIIGIVFALFCRMLNFRLPETLSQSGHYLAATALPLALICVGASFDFKSLFKIKDFSLWASMARVTISPALAIVVGLAFGLDKITFGVLFLMSATPIAAAAFVMVQAMGGNSKAAANIIGMTTLFSMITAPIWITLLRWKGVM